MNKEKIKNILLYFTESIANLPITKAMKLLFYSDFTSFARTGKSITGLDYHAWDQGPVPPVVYTNLTKNRYDFTHIERKGNSLLIKKSEGAVCDTSVFNSSELDIIAEILKASCESSATELSEQTHQEIPWLKTERYGKISYEWAKLQDSVASGEREPEDEEIIMDIIERNPALHHFYEDGLEEWAEACSDEDASSLYDLNDVILVHWEKGLGWVRGN